MTKTNSNAKEIVLVTGGSGFVGAHCILQLLDKGYRVRTTLRSLSKKNEVIEMLKNGGAETVEDLSFIEADLSGDEIGTRLLRTVNMYYTLHRQYR